MTASVKKIVPAAGDERGFILIITMLVLVVLTVICIGALDNSNFEMQIASNDRQSRVAFNMADGGVYASGKLVTEAIDGGGDPDHAAQGLQYVNIYNPLDPNYEPFIDPASPKAAAIAKIANGVDLFHSRVMGFTPLRDPVADGPYDFMLRVPGGNGDIFGRVTGRAAEVMAGGSTEFGTGSTGVGAGSAGSTAITYDIDIDAYAARNATSQLAVRYRKVLGAAGGL